MISDQAKKEIDIWVAKYPEGRQSSAVMEAFKDCASRERRQFG